MSSFSSKSSGKNGLKTGVGAWYQLCDEEGRFYFFNTKTKETAWGLRLRDIFKEEEVLSHSAIGQDDWECSIDPNSGKKFFQSVKYKKVQWTVPLLYRSRLSKLPYFQQRRTSTVGDSSIKAERPKLKKQMSMQTLIGKITIESVLDDDTACASFHKYLVATHAEENLLFFGAAEVFRKGKWKGMSVIGVAPEQTEEADNEGENLLQQQLVRTRASVRVGLDQRVSAGREARVIFDKFLKSNAPMEICVSSSIANKVKEEIESGKKIEDRSLFLAAQEEVLRTLEEDSLPRFLRLGLSDQVETVGHGEFQFTTDSVVKTALERLATSP